MLTMTREALRAGGVLIWPLLACSVLLWTLIVWRALHLQRQRFVAADQLYALARATQTGSGAGPAPDAAGGIQMALLQVVAAGGSSGELDRRARAAVDCIAPPLDLTRCLIQLAALLGLLGTVSGMMDAFATVAIAGLGDVSVLGGSISKALVTTLVGLVVAIPSLFAYHFFKSRTNIFGVELEEEATEMISEWMMKKAPAGEEA